MEAEAIKRFRKGFRAVIAVEVFVALLEVLEVVVVEFFKAVVEVLEAAVVEATTVQDVVNKPILL